ncbi:MAG: hypothetical protein ACRCWM_05085 [Sarcina sp.]
MFFAGLPVDMNRTVLRVQNKSDKKIEKIVFGTDKKESVANIKKIDSETEKKTSISNFDEVIGLKMTIKGCEKSYIIKERVEAKKKIEILIIVKDFNQQECDFKIEY